MTPLLTPQTRLWLRQAAVFAEGTLLLAATHCVRSVAQPLARWEAHWLARARHEAITSAIHTAIHSATESTLPSPPTPKPEPPHHEDARL